DPDRGERVEVHRAHFDVLDAALAQGVQRPLTGARDALGAYGAVELVLDLQQAGGELPVALHGVTRSAAFADADGLVRRVGMGERVVERGGVAFEAVVADE